LIYIPTPGNYQLSRGGIGMDNTTKFLVYCVEIYKTAHKLNGKQVMQLFNKHQINEYIINCYEALHTTGPEYIIDDIDGLIAERNAA